MPTPSIFSKRNLLMTFFGPEHLIPSSSDCISSTDKIHKEIYKDPLFFKEAGESFPCFCLIFIN